MSILTCVGGSRVQARCPSSPSSPPRSPRRTHLPCDAREGSVRGGDAVDDVKQLEALAQGAAGCRRAQMDAGVRNQA